MLEFAHLCGLAFVGTMLLATGGGHVAGLRAFRRLLREHELLPTRLAAPVAVLVAGAELAVGLAAVVALARGEASLGMAAYAAAVGLGGAFVVYLRRLVRAGHTGSCGCSPLTSSLSRASFVPAGSLTAAGVAGLLAGWVPTGAPQLLGAESLLAVPWGLTLAALVLLLPATVSQTVTEAPR